MNSFGASLLKDAGNLPQGKSTYGLWEFISFCDATVFDSWVTMAQVSGTGMCGGLIITAVFTRLLFVPLGIYSQLTSHKLKLLQPDMDESHAKMKSY